MLPQEETDLSFADFGGSRRQYTAVAKSESDPNKNTPGVSDRGRYQNLEHETGFEPATLTLAKRIRTRGRSVGCALGTGE